MFRNQDREVVLVVCPKDHPIRLIGLLGFLVFWLLLLPFYSWAAGSIATDGRAGPATILVGPNFAIPANLGQQSGANLFHSFATFNLVNGESATFSGPNTVANIIARVTGGASSIDGTIASSIPGSNLFFINPAGLLFGPHAQINVPGAFHASTADYLRFSDGATFGVSTPNGSSFTAAAPKAFGFMSNNPASLTVNGSTLAASSGTQISLIGSGGGVSLSGATITAFPGTVHIASIAGPGEIGVDPKDTASLTATSFGPISLSNASIVRVNNSGANPPGSIEIRGGQITIADGSEVISSTSGPGQGAEIDIFATASLVVDGSTRPDISTGIASIVRPTGTGTGGAINVQVGGSMSLTSGGLIASETAGAGDSGTVSVAAGTLSMDAATTPLFGGIYSSVDAFGFPFGGGIFAFNGFAGFSAGIGTGNAGNIAVVAGQTAITGSANIGSYAFGSGNGGNLIVNSSAMLIDGTTTAGLFTGVDTLGLGSGFAGSINVQSTQMTVNGNGQITSQALADGNSGNVTVSASNLIIDGSSLTPLGQLLPTGISTVSTSTGEAGTVNVSGGTITLRAGAGIFSSTALGTAAGVSGAVNVTAGTLSIDGSGSSFLTGVTSIVTQGALVAAGALDVRADNISILNRGEISSSTFASTDAGPITINAGSLVIRGDGTGVLTGIASDAEAASTGGNGGSVAVAAGTIDLSFGGKISSNTFSTGNGGNVSVNASSILADGSGSNFPTGITAASRTGATGNAGSVSVQTGSLQIQNGAAISSAANGIGGNGGDVNVAVSGDAQLQGVNEFGNAASISALATDSGNAGTVVISANNLTLLNGGTVTTEATAGGGGNISIAVARLLHLQNGSISTSVGGGVGNGGNILIDPQFTVLNPGSITAHAVLGHGGNITIDPNGGIFFASPDSIVSASAGIPANNGTVLIEAPSVDVTASLAELSGKIAPPPQLSRSSCAGAAAGEKSSSLTLGSRGGLPETGDGPIAGTYFVDRSLQMPKPGGNHSTLQDFSVARWDCAAQLVPLIALPPTALSGRQPL